jgi:hypothetical protein
MTKLIWKYVLCVLIAANGIGIAFADEVTEWNRIMLDAGRTANVSPIVMTRIAAIVQSAVYDAVNGVERRYAPIYVEPAAAPGASRRAAAVQAAYATLVRLFPAQRNAFDMKLEASLGAISSGEAVENSESISRGIQWGQAVADAVWSWRSADGFTPAPPPFIGGAFAGQWRPTPPAFAAGAALQFSYMTPWAIQSPSQFLPDAPPALNSDQYTADFNETKQMGSPSSPTRTVDQTAASQFWASTIASDFNRVAAVLSAERHTNLSENAHLFGLLNIAIADATIACFNAKYSYNFWRPVTAIPLADTDNNAGTAADSNWVPLIVTPAFPEYPSAHSCLSGAAATVLSNYFGENTSFVMEWIGNPGGARFFPNFTAVLNEIADARVFGGIHFRTACVAGQQLGREVANYILVNSARRVKGGL